MSDTGDIDVGPNEPLNDNMSEVEVKPLGPIPKSNNDSREILIAIQTMFTQLTKQMTD